MDTINDIATIHEFMKKIGNAGFASAGMEFRDFEKSLPCRVSHGRPLEEDLLRQLYLISIGLGKFSLNPCAVSMVGKNASCSDQLKFQRDIWHQYFVNPEDERLFDPKIDVTQLGIVSAPWCGKRTVTIGESLARINSNRPRLKLGNVWHMQWLYRHQEFIPEEWMEILKKGGWILFPGVRVHFDYNGEKSKPRFPYFRSYPVDYSFDGEEGWKFTQPNERRRMFFVFVGKKEKIPTLVQKEGKTVFIKT